MITKEEFRGVATVTARILGRAKQLEGDTPKRAQRWIIHNDGDISVSFVVKESSDGTTYANAAAGALTVPAKSSRLQEVYLAGASTHFAAYASTASGESAVRANLETLETPGIL